MVKISGAKISKPRNTRAPAPPAHARARARAAKIFKVLCARARAGTNPASNPSPLTTTIESFLRTGPSQPEIKRSKVPAYLIS